MLLNLIFLKLRKSSATKLNRKSNFHFCKNSKLNSSLISFKMGIILGVTIVAMVLVMANYIITNFKRNSTPSPLSGKIINKANHNKATKRADLTTNYDFYKLLSQNHNELKDKNVQIKLHAPPKPITTTNIKQYNLELGRFNNVKLADELKAKLALYGFEANVIKIKPNKKFLEKFNFIVTIGPLTKETAATTQNNLTLLGFKNIWVKNLE